MLTERRLPSGRAPSDVPDDPAARARGGATAGSGRGVHRWLGTAPGLLAGMLDALLAGWTVIGYIVHEATERLRTAERAATSGLQWLQTLAEVSSSLSQPIDRDRLLRQITDALASLTSAHNVGLWEVDAASGHLVRRAWTAAPSSLGGEPSRSRAFALELPAAALHEVPAPAASLGAP